MRRATTQACSTRPSRGKGSGPNRSPPPHHPAPDTALTTSKVIHVCVAQCRCNEALSQIDIKGVGRDIFWPPEVEYRDYTGVAALLLLLLLLVARAAFCN